MVRGGSVQTRWLERGAGAPEAQKPWGTGPGPGQHQGGLAVAQAPRAVQRGAGGRGRGWRALAWWALQTGRAPGTAPRALQPRGPPGHRGLLAQWARQAAGSGKMALGPPGLLGPEDPPVGTAGRPTAQGVCGLLALLRVRGRGQLLWNPDAKGTSRSQARGQQTEVAPLARERGRLGGQGTRRWEAEGWQQPGEGRQAQARAWTAARHLGTGTSL